MIGRLRRILDYLLRVTRENPRLSPVHPAVDAIDTFLFGKGDVTAGAPHVRGHMDVKRFMSVVILCLLPCAAWGVYAFGWRVAALIAVSYIFGVGVEAIFAGARKETLNEGAFVTCLLFPLTLPPTTPFWVCAVGIVFGIVFGKEVFGGTGYNVFNPALVGRCFVYISFPRHMVGGVWTNPIPGAAGGFAAWDAGVDAVTSATPAHLTTLQECPVPFGDLLFGLASGSVGETLRIWIVAAGLILAALVQVFVGLAPLRTLRTALGKVRSGETQRLEGTFPDELTPLIDEFKQIRNAAQRSSDLTNQLLAFARQQPVSPRVLDLNATVAGMFKMLSRLIGEDIELVTVAAPGIGAIRIDPGQVEQILVNLVVNARDAIAGSGRIEIATGAATLDAAFCADHPGAVPGEYARLTVRDTGCGMDAETLSKATEPFFTTKGVGKGSGLGLPMVHGLAEQSGGRLALSSAPGQATSAELWLRAAGGVGGGGRCAGRRQRAAFRRPPAPGPAR